MRRFSSAARAKAVSASWSVPSRVEAFVGSARRPSSQPLDRGGLDLQQGWRRRSPPRPGGEVGAQSSEGSLRHAACNESRKSLRFCRTCLLRCGFAKDSFRSVHSQMRAPLLQHGAPPALNSFGERSGSGPVGDLKNLPQERPAPLPRGGTCGRRLAGASFGRPLPRPEPLNAPSIPTTSPQRRGGAGRARAARIVRIGQGEQLAVLAGPLRTWRAGAHALETAAGPEGDRRGGLGSGLVYKSSFDKANRTSADGRAGHRPRRPGRSSPRSAKPWACRWCTDVHAPGQCARRPRRWTCCRSPPFCAARPTCWWRPRRRARRSTSRRASSSPLGT